MSLNVNGSLELNLGTEEFVKKMNECDIVLLSETWTNESSDINVSDFDDPICKHRKRKLGALRDSGGLCCYFKKHIIKGVTQLPWDFEDGVSFKLDKSFFGWREDLYIIFVYVRPSSSSRNDLIDGVNVFETIQNEISKYADQGGIVCVGDFNARVAEKLECLITDENSENTKSNNLSLLQCNMHSVDDEDERVIDKNDILNNGMSVKRVNKDKATNDHGAELLSMCYASDMIILNGRTGDDKGVGDFTFVNHRGTSTNDFVICDKKSLYYVCKFVIDNVNIFSDHKTLLFDLCINVTSIKENEEHFNRNIVVEKRARWRDENKGDFLTNLNKDEINHRLNSLHSLLTDDNTTIDDSQLEYCIGELTDVLSLAGEKNIKSISKGGNSKHIKNNSWYDEDCNIQKLIFEEFRHRWYETGDDSHRLRMCVERNKYRKMCRDKKREANLDEAQKLLFLGKHNQKEFWNKIRDKPNIDVPNCNFFEHFKSLANKESNIGEEGKRNIENEIQERIVEVDELDKDIDIIELEAAIKELKKNKASGDDLILNEFIIYAPMKIKLILLCIFNCILNKEIFPSFWAIGNIVPIFKKGDKHNVNNYRGITIISCIGKLFTRILNKRLSKWAEKEHKINESQLGFRKQKSTTDCIFILNGLIDVLFSKGKKLYAAFIDYEKAYDYLDRAALFCKLTRCGVSSKCINIFKSMYEKMKLNVKNDCNKEMFNSTIGLLQGESTSPLFFSIFVNDINEFLSEFDVGTTVLSSIIRLLMFADDTVIFSETRQGLQTGLDGLREYCSKWGLTVNEGKTKVIVFRKGGRLGKKDKWYFGERLLEVVTNFKYLGCSISSSGSFKNCLLELTNSANRGLFALKKYFQKNNQILPETKLKLFNTMITPILTYGCEIWGLNPAERIETFYLKFLKGVLGIKKSTPTCYVYGELGIFPLTVIRKIRIVKYWTGILDNLDNEHLIVNKIYKELLEINIKNPNFNTWVSGVRRLLEESGMGNYWYAQDVGNKNLFIREFTKRTENIYLQNWQASVDMTSDYRLFKKLKLNFGFENYLRNVVNSSFRTAITKIRLSSHSFKIERDRWGSKKIKVVDRKCEICPNSIEDELHCLVDCPRFINERRDLLPNRLVERKNEYELIRFLCTDDLQEQNKLGKLCHSVQSAYRNYMFS